MSHRTQDDVRRECKQRGIPFRVVAEVYSDLRTLHREERRREWEMRQRAWEAMTPKGCHGFWRHGFHVRYKRAFAEGDRTNIPGFDLLADELAYEFPELRAGGDPAEALFNFLSQPHDTLPPADDVWCEAAEMVFADADEPVPF